MKNVYLAGGWFTKEQDELHSRIYRTLKNVCKVYNPRIEGEIITKKYNNFNEASSEVLLGNIKGIQDADVVVVIYDYKDTGTIWEAGFAYANNKTIIYYSETNGNKPFNLMLAKTGYYVTNGVDLLNLLKQDLKYSPVYEYNGEIE